MCLPFLALRRLSSFYFFFHLPRLHFFHTFNRFYIPFYSHPLLALHLRFSSYIAFHLPRRSSLFSAHWLFTITVTLSFTLTPNFPEVSTSAVPPRHNATLLSPQRLGFCFIRSILFFYYGTIAPSWDVLLVASYSEFIISPFGKQLFFSIFSKEEALGLITKRKIKGPLLAATGKWNSFISMCISVILINICREG